MCVSMYVYMYTYIYIHINIYIICIYFLIYIYIYIYSFLSASNLLFPFCFSPVFFFLLFFVSFLFFFYPRTICTAADKNLFQLDACLKSFLLTQNALTKTRSDTNQRREVTTSTPNVNSAGAIRKYSINPLPSLPFSTHPSLGIFHSLISAAMTSLRGQFLTRKRAVTSVTLYYRNTSICRLLLLLLLLLLQLPFLLSLLTFHTKRIW